MKKLLRYMKSYRKECALGPLAKLLEASFELLVPLVVAGMIDRGIGQQDRGYLILMTVVLAGLGIIGLAFAVTAQYFAAKAATGFVARLRQVLFDHLQTLSYRELDSLGTSAMLTRMTSDMNQVQNGVNLTLRLALRSPFVVFGAMIMAFTIDASAAGIFAVAIPILFAVVLGIMGICIPLYRRVQGRLDSVTLAARENLTGSRVVRAFRTEASEQANFARKADVLAKAQSFVGRLSSLTNPLTFVIINLAIVWLIHTGAIRVNEGTLTQGQVVALYNYMSQILVELVKTANLILSITQAIACGNRIQSVLELRPSLTYPDTAPAVGTPGIRFDHVTFRYHESGDPALKNLSLTVQPGQTVGIIGGTGAGKTTLVNLLCRFYDTTQGSITIDQADVRSYPKADLRRKFGIVPQKAVLFRGTIRDNLLWGDPNATDEELMFAVQAAQASDVIAGKGGLDAAVDAGGRNFSGGQRQRLTIARALVGRPEILILDDSASALDYATDRALRRSLKELGYRPTVFIVSQRTASLRHADQIVVLDNGRVCGIGSHDDLLKNCEIYREIHESQYGKCEKV